jgi:hypothetical protein
MTIELRLQKSHKNKVAALQEEMEIDARRVSQEPGAMSEESSVCALIGIKAYLRLLC